MESNVISSMDTLPTLFGKTGYLSKAICIAFWLSLLQWGHLLLHFLCVCSNGSGIIRHDRNKWVLSKWSLAIWRSTFNGHYLLDYLARLVNSLGSKLIYT